MTEQDIRGYYGIPPEAYLPRSAEELRVLAALLYAGWRSFESKQAIQPSEEMPPPQFFHIATELCSMVWSNRNFQRPEHILWPKHD